MKVTVQVKTRSKKEGIEKLSDGTLVARVSVPPIEGKANKRIIELLSKYLGVPKTQIRLLQGEKSRVKIFEY